MQLWTSNLQVHAAKRAQMFDATTKSKRLHYAIYLQNRNGGGREVSEMARTLIGSEG